MANLLSRVIHTSSPNRETTADRLAAFWWKPTSATTPLLQPAVPHAGPMRLMRVGIGGWAKTYVALDWRWLTPWPDDGIRTVNGGFDSHASGITINFHTISGDNGGVGWSYPPGVSPVAFFLSPNDSRFYAHLEYQGVWEPALTFPAASVWQSFMCEVTWGRKNDDIAYTRGLANQGRLRVWQGGTLTLDSNTTYPNGLNTLIYSGPSGTTTDPRYIQQYVDFWQGGPYTGGSPLNVSGDMNLEMTAARVGSTPEECLGDSTIIANVGLDFATVYDSTRGLARSAGSVAAGHNGDSWATVPATGTRTTDDFSVPAEFAPNPGATAPSLSVAPAVSGTKQSGNTLTSTDGTWANVPTSFARQWQRTFDESAIADISSATSSTYPLVTADVGFKVRCRVTATNVAGSAVAYSAWTTVVKNTDGGYVQDGGFETGVSLWGPIQTPNETRTQTTAEHDSGSNSMLVDTNGTGTFRGATYPLNSGIAVNPGDKQRLNVKVKAASGTIRVSSAIRDNTGTVIGSIEQYQTMDGTWKSFAVSDAVVLPAGSSWRTVSVTTGTVSQNLAFYVDTVDVIDYVDPPPASMGSRSIGGTRSGGSRSGGSRSAGGGGWF